MKREEELIEQLQQQTTLMMSSIKNSDKIGSLIFCYDDDAEASITFSKWKSNEFPFSLPVKNNIDLQAFDVKFFDEFGDISFDCDDMEVVMETVEDFYQILRHDPLFLQLPLRKGFQFCYFSSKVGAPLDGIEDTLNDTLEQAINVITRYVNEVFIQSKINNLKEITFSSEKEHVKISLSGDEQYHSSYHDSDIGMALTQLMASPEDNFYMLCQHIIQTEKFITSTKNDEIAFKIFLNEKEFFVNTYKVNSHKLTKIDLHSFLA